MVESICGICYPSADALVAASRLSTAHKPLRSKLRDICCALQFVLTARRVPCEGLRIAPAAEASEQVPIAGMSADPSSPCVQGGWLPDHSPSGALPSLCSLSLAAHGKRFGAEVVSSGGFRKARSRAAAAETRA